MKITNSPPKGPKQIPDIAVSGDTALHSQFRPVRYETCEPGNDMSDKLYSYQFENGTCS